MIQFLQNIVFPLELDTLRGWRILLTILVIVGSIVYAILWYVVEKKSWPQEKKKSSSVKSEYRFQQLFTSRQITKDTLHEKVEHIVHEVEAIIDEELGWEEELEWEEETPLSEIREESVAPSLPRWKKLMGKKAPIVQEEYIQEEENIHQENIQEEHIQEEDIPQSEILMTADMVDQLEQHNKTQIKREEFKADLDYLKKRQKWDEYESKLIEWLAQDPDHADILEHLADFYMMDNQPKKALPLYKKLVEKYPEQHVLLRKMAQVYLSMKDLQMAEVLVDRALALHPDTPKYAMYLVEIYYGTERKQEALRMLERIVERRPNNLSYRTTLVNLYEEFELYDKVVDAYESMLLIDPTNVMLKRKLLEARTQIQ